MKNQKCQNLGPKIPNFCIFGLEFENIFLIFEISLLKFVLLQSLVKEKHLNLGPKMFDLGIFGLEFEKNIVIFEITTFHFVKLQNFGKNA